MCHTLRMLFVLTLAAPTTAAAGIAHTKHDLAWDAAGLVAPTGGTDHRCRFCHIAHRARADHAGLWVQSSSRGSGWNSGRTLALDGTPLEVPTGQDGRRSQRCLSCHDGTVARNIAAIVGGASFGGGMNHGRDHDGRHPVSSPFAGQAGSDTATEQYGVASPTACAKGVPLCVKDAAQPAAGAYVRLFGRSGAYRVECSSCHDPHQDNLTGEHPQFLRIPKSMGVNSGCTACHKK